MEANETGGTSRPRRANELGPTGSRLAENVKAIRERLPLTTEQLAQRITGLGRPMRANTITKIEKGQRRVDIDDAVALAVALEVNLTTLVLPYTTKGTVQLTETTTVDAADAWNWADGRRPLRVPEGDDGSALVDFQRHARPRNRRSWNVTTPAGMLAAASETGNARPEKIRELREALGYPASEGTQGEQEA
jgi:transcriptional regulator with XRE-family HTH domain